MQNVMTRDEHMSWCKARALEYCVRGELKDALMSMISDLGKHPETDAELAKTLGMGLFMNGHLSDPTKMAEFINGFR